MKTCLVIPSIRMDCLREFFAAWECRLGVDSIITIEDAAEKSGIWGTWNPGSGPGLDHYSHKEIRTILGEDSWIISRRNSACRIFGFLAAWWAGYDAVVTLDDDCYPMPGTQNFVEEHLAALNGHRRWVEAIPGVRTRGLPYRNLGTLGNVKINVGLWSNNPDLDAPCSLVKGDGAGFMPPVGSRIIPSGQFAPMCGMNVFAMREAIPLLFQPPMGEGQPFDRFEDIWGGIIAKKVMDHLGWPLSMGMPFVEHKRASNPFTNLQKEAAGISENEVLWEMMDDVGIIIRDGGSVIMECLDDIGNDLMNRGYYAQRIGMAIHTWCRLFTERPKGL